MSFFGGKIGVYSPPCPNISSENSQNCLKILPHIWAFYSMSKCQKILIQSKVMAISNLAVRHQKWSLYMGTPTFVWPTAWSLFVQKFKTKLFWGLYMVKIQPQKPGLESRFWLKRTWSPTVLWGFPFFLTNRIRSKAVCRWWWRQRGKSPCNV